MTLPVAVAVAIIGCVLAVSANVTSNEMHNTLGQERYKRMVAEEQLQKANNYIKKLEIELVETREKIKGIQEIITKGHSTNADLTEQLKAANRERELLKRKLQDSHDRRAESAPAKKPEQ